MMSASSTARTETMPLPVKILRSTVSGPPRELPALGGGGDG
jgi:hypothetical protein